MAGFIIATFRFLVYLLFILITLGGAVAGYAMAYRYGYQPVFGGAVGLVAGFLNAVIVTGVMVILLDIQDSLRDLARANQETPGELHHYHHHEEVEPLGEPAPAQPVRQERRR